MSKLIQLKMGQQEVYPKTNSKLLSNDNGWIVIKKTDGKKIFRRTYELATTQNLAANSGTNLYYIPMPNNLPINHIKKMFVNTNVRELIWNWHVNNIIQIHNTSISAINLSLFIANLEIEEI